MGEAGLTINFVGMEATSAAYNVEFNPASTHSNNA